MSASQLFDWPTAKAALNVGWRVRRSAWTDRWLERWTGGLIWLILSDGTKRVVQNTDFGNNEFNAVDWTNLPPECVTSGTTAGTGTNGCPLPYNPTTTTPTTPTTPTDPTPSTPVDPSSPPTGGSGAGQTGSGGGGGGGGGSGSNTPRRDPQNTTWPTLSVTASDQQNDCYGHTEAGNYVHPNFIVSVSMSNPANYSGPSFFFITVKNGPNVVGTGTLAPGGEQSFQWSDPFPAAPGSTLTFNARAWASGAPDLQASGSGTLKPWCDTPCQPPYCCPGEDGHKCGTGCCCCPAYYAPNGPNCECIYVG